ncbi:MAG: hypothetical protein SFY32_17300 [Bacteroidota bacterium]|nr:hypothetical protein [Bacteroidota bacterium]
MKKNITALLTIITIIIGCQTKKTDPNPSTPSSSLAVPTTFRIPIPSSLNGTPKTTSRMENGRIEAADPALSGNVIYEGLRGYIKLGDDAASLVTSIMGFIKTYNLTTEMNVTFKDDKDNKFKTIIVVKNAKFENSIYEYRLLIRDSSLRLSAIEVFFNSAPIKGTAIISYNAVEPNNTVAGSNPMYRIDYDENPGGGAEKRMQIYISGVSSTVGLTALRMNVTKTGDILDIVGNSNHPNVMAGDLALGTINYAFRAKVNIALNTGVAEIALPLSSITTINNTLMDTYSIKNVLKNAAVAKWGSANESLINDYLKNANPPGFFDQTGFLYAGSAPSSVTGFNGLSTLTGLMPFVPNDIQTLNVQFSK